ncbi:hypothetical protein BKA66DRAFT_604629 [Pyrenochaeta sp. MPI-SDFR-AT-0127]|nr:hypothetical protein BKA66DRAFT_604629 [Pyrenochaeta sp. MPI-SDFR-AT-0127]
MLADRDPNGSGRNSRASNFSTISRATGKQPYGLATSDLLSSAAPGVMSMLRTSTEMGNVAGVTGDLSVMGNIPRAPQRRGASSRLSSASSLSNNSSRASRHHRQYPSSSTGARRSSMREPTGPQFIADTLSPTMMNISGSSLIPLSVRARDEHRSLSMTHTMQPTYRLSTNRSLGSLRHEPEHRPKSPYHYPTRLRRPSYRPASPALSDNTGSHPRRHNRPRSQGQPHHPGQMRRRVPSDMSLGQQERVHRMSRRGPPSGYYSGPRPDIPPMPPMYQHHIAVEQARMLSRSKKGSMSSGSTNLRADSDTPSSEIASPQTPKGSASMEVLTSLNGTRMIVDAATGTLREDISSRPLYYDYSEQFEREHYQEHEVDPIPTGFVNQIKTIMEERGSSVPSASMTAYAPEAKVSVEVLKSEMPDIAELPASPVPRRITRDLVLKALEPSSTVGDMEPSMTFSVSGENPGSVLSENLPAMHHTLNTELAGAPTNLTERMSKRHSILSQAGSSVLDSSTLNFAVRYSIPMAVGAKFDAELVPEPGGTPASPKSFGRSTEDGMSELLAGYQHSETKHDSDVVQKAGATAKKTDISTQQVEKRINHAQKSSDEQSFKSCTDEPEPASPPRNETDDGDRGKPVIDVVPKQEPSVKESDAHSFTTAKDAVTPDRAASMPMSRLSSSYLANSDLRYGRPASEVPVSNPPPALLRKQPPMPSCESSFALASRFRTNSKPSVKQCITSVSSSSSTLSATQQPPSVPPRESSSSKEAQRYQAVASFLMRQLPSRLAKRRKSTQDEAKPKANGRAPTFCEPMQETRGLSGAESSSSLPFDDIVTPEKALIKQKVVIEKQPTASNLLQSDTSSTALGYGATSALHQQPSSNLSPVIPEPSSVYSPQDISLKYRVQSSPDCKQRSPEYGQRESQTTTHLVWHGRRSLSTPSTGANECQTLLPDVQENTTTDLRLSGYRYAGPPHYLPDLKEESHEDSSLNTSASNLKNSSFRFPTSGPPGVRASVDDAIIFSRRSSMGFHQRGGLGSTTGRGHGLPSMEFSQLNLFDKLSEEFGLRNSRSLQGLPTDSPDVEESGPQRSASAREVREKYHNLLSELDSELKISGASAHKPTAFNLGTLKRPGSPKKILAEIDQLTIPSVGGLTQRISELLPSLREYYKLSQDGEFMEEEAIMEHAIEEIHEVGPPAQKRSSARLRPVPGSPNMVVIDDTLFEELTSKEKEEGNLESQSDEAVEVGVGAVDSDVNGNGEGGVHEQPHQKCPNTNLEIPSPAVLRPRSSTVGHQDLGSSTEVTLTSRRSLRSFVSTPTATDTRPWNFDKNYPWATTTLPSVDISLPPPTAAKHSPPPGPSHLRNRFSEASTSSSFSSANTATASPFGTTSDSNAHARQHRFSIFGRSGNQPHAAGERYPTSALTPPTAIFRDHSSAFDTSDDEEFSTARNKSKLKLRERFSSARNATLDNAARVGRSKTNPLELASPESTHQSAASNRQDRPDEEHAFTTSHRHTFRDAEGMRTAEYHRNKIIDHLKKWWHKGGDLIRNLSRRSRQRPNIT